jgi:PleD family two-component response regulator
MRQRIIHILLVEKDPSDARFVRDALAELEEVQLGNSWLSPYELTDAEDLDELALLVAHAQYDVILADLRLDDANGLDNLRRLRSLAKQTPIVALTRKEDPALAVRLMQEGVEDVLAKCELDCAPLGRALRAAIERHRIGTRLRSMAIRDDLSGLLNFTGFVQMGEQLARLTARSASNASCVLFHLEHFETLADRIGRQEEEWLLLECTESLRAASEEGDVLAYLGQGRFAWLSLDRDERSIRESLEAQESELAARFLKRGHAISLRYRSGIAVLNADLNWNLLTAMERAEQQSWATRVAPARELELHACIH